MGRSVKGKAQRGRSISVRIPDEDYVALELIKSKDSTGNLSISDLVLHGIRLVTGKTTAERKTWSL